MTGTKDIKDFTKYPSLSDDDVLLASKTSVGGTDAGITVGNFKRQVASDAAPLINDNGYWVVNGVSTGEKARGETPVFIGGTTTTGDAGTLASSEVIKDGETVEGQPKYKINLTVPRGEVGEAGKTAVFDIGTVSKGDAASATLQPDGNDSLGNPKYKLNIVLPKGDKGDNGKTPKFEVGDVTTLSPGELASVVVAFKENDSEGSPIYTISFSLPKGDKGDPGKTLILESVSAVSGNTPSGSFTQNGVDASGNPKYILNLTLPKGKDGQPPVFEQGTTTTLAPNEQASVDVIENGETPEGNPKYLLNFSIPRGQQGLSGTGSGNVSVEGTGLVAGKKYLFVPNADGSPVGAFVEYELPSVATGEKAGLMSPEQFQKLENLNPTFLRFLVEGLEKGRVGYESNATYLYNAARAKKVEYTDAGKLLFEGKEAFAVDADNELTLAGKKLSELGGQYLDLTPLISDQGPVTTVTDEFFAQVESAYNSRITSAYADGGITPITIINNADHFRITLNIPQLVSHGANGINDAAIIIQEFTISKTDKSVQTNYSVNELMNTGDGTKFKSDDGTYKAIEGYQLPVANSTVLGGIKTGYTQSDKNYPVQLDATNKAYVNVPWTDTDTTYSLATTLANGLLRQLNGSTTSFMRGDGTWATPPDTTYSPATQSANGLMSSADKKKLDRIGSYTRTTTTLANLDVNYETILVTLNANDSLSVNLFGTDYDTWETHVFVRSMGANRTVTIPTTGSYVSMCGSSVTIPSGKWCEFSLKCINSIWHIAKLEQE